MLTLHLTAKKEPEIEVLIPDPNTLGKFVDPDALAAGKAGPTFVPQTLTGQWVRVFPKTSRDVMFLRMLDHHIDKFAPLHGDGVIIRHRCLTGRWV